MRAGREVCGEASLALDIILKYLEYLYQYSQYRLQTVSAGFVASTP